MFEPIGYVKSTAKEKVDHNWGEVASEIIIHEELKDGLIGLSSFSHIIVVYHLNEAKSSMTSSYPQSSFSYNSIYKKTIKIKPAPAKMLKHSRKV